MAEAVFHCRKAFRHARFLLRLWRAAMFGRYRHTVWDNFDYAVFEYRGKQYAVPTSEMDFD